MIGHELPGHVQQRVVGFALVWHHYGGMAGLLATGRWSRSGIYRQRADFYRRVGVPVESWSPVEVDA